MKIISEETAVVTKGTIEDIVMAVLSGEGGAAGLDPIEDELEELEDDEISLPDEPIEDLVGDVPGVKRHVDGDYVDTTQLEGRRIRITTNLLRRIIKEAVRKQKMALPSGLAPTMDYTVTEDDSGSKHPKQYGAPEGSKRDKQLDQTQADFKKVKELRKKGNAKQAKELEQRAYKRRDRMEKKEREKNESIIRALIEAVLDEEDFKTHMMYDPETGEEYKAEKPEDHERMAKLGYVHEKPEKVNEEDLNEDDLDEELSAKTKKSLDKKADKRGFTRGSVYKEFEKGLAAFATSGSRKGMSAHQWAHARVNSANPSKKWAVVKKSKAKKK
tara:strand:+ start:73 stop:1059 length:987 start_codon:yes stop_codon:yes gene_type:complete